ncbi:MAG: hypothetical protein WC980_02465 [Candidatus Brocadiia bacterium]
MNEARRILRYIFPSAALFIELGFYLFLCHTPSIRNAVADATKTGSDISATTLLIFAATGIGYLLGMIYHVLYWTKRFDYCGVNHQEVIISAEKMKWLELRRQNDDTEVKANALSRAGAWHVVSGTWHAGRETSCIIKGANERTDSLSDIVHGFGTALIGSVFALCFWLILLFKNGTTSIPWNIIPVFILALVIIGIHGISYKTAVKRAEGVIEILFLGALKYEYEKGHKIPVTVYVSSKDINENGGNT